MNKRWCDELLVCRAPYTNNSLKDKCHSERWNRSLGLHGKGRFAGCPL